MLMLLLLVFFLIVLISWSCSLVRRSRDGCGGRNRFVLSELLEHLDEEGSLWLVIETCTLLELLAWDAFLVWKSRLWDINRQGVLHSVEVKILFDEMGHKACLFTFMYFLSGRVLPLKASCLFSSRLGILLYSLEHPGSKLCSERTQCNFITLLFSLSFFYLPPRESISPGSSNRPLFLSYLNYFKSSKPVYSWDWNY